MNGIGLEFDDVEVAIGTAHQMGLSTGPHFAYMLDCRKRGRKRAGLRCERRPFKVKSSHVLPVLIRRDAVRASLGVSASGVARSLLFRLLFASLLWALLLIPRF